MSNVSNCVRTAQAVGITASGITSGGILNFSLALIPVITLPAANTKRAYDQAQKPGTPMSHVATQFRHAYSIGKGIVPIISIVSGAAYSYLAYTFRQETLLRAPNITTSNWYIVSAILAVAPIPYTLIVMSQTVKNLIARAEATDAEGTGVQKEKDAKGELRASREDAEMQNWLKNWAEMNCVRGMFPLAATVIGLIATLY